MIGMIIMCVVITAVVGLAAKFVLDRMKTAKEITWKEYGLVMAILTVIVFPATVYIGWESARKNLITFNEFYNGWETDIKMESITCERDGYCGHEYSCDPYEVCSTCDCDDKGNCSTCCHTEYHSCPYVNEEFNYIVSTNLGEFMIDDHRFPDDPQRHRWRQSESIPNSVIEQAGTGEPPFWTAAKERVQSGKPGPVTKRYEYKNYIYASEQTILKQYSTDIERYERKNLFPKFQKDIFSHYYADKVYFVGFKPDNIKDWLVNSYYLNAAVGRNLEGDLHLVLVKNDEVARDVDTYNLSLKTYWQDTKRHDKDAMSKNAIVVICVTDGNKILAARSFTGMPLGNEQMTVAINNRLKGAELKPETILGTLRGELKTNKWIENVHSTGILEDVLFGMSEKQTKFKRISMSAENPKDNGRGFVYLFSQIQPTERQKTYIYIGAFIFSLIGWGVAIAIGDKTYKRNNFIR